MKVLLVSSNSGSRGGGEIYLRYLMEGLSKIGCEVHTLVGSDASMDELAVGISEISTVHRLKLTNTYRRLTRSLGAVFDVGQRRQVRRFIERLAPDVVHINQQVAEDGLDLVLAARESGRPFVSTIHITQSATELSARFAWVRDSVAKYVLSRGGSKYIAVSAVTAKRLSCRMPCLDASSIPVVYCGVDIQDCELIEKNRVQARSDWGLADDDVAVGAVGRIEEQKNPLFLVDIISDLVASNRNPRLVWIGDGALRPALETRAFERGVADRLIIDGWRDDACLRMAGLDIVAMPSRFEGLPLALLEAMHVGLAVCVSDAGGMPEAVTNGRDGLIRSVSAPEAWREAIGGLLDEPTVRGRLGKAARNTAQTRFGLEAMARATLAVYEQEIAETARRQRDALAG